MTTIWGRGIITDYNLSGTSEDNKQKDAEKKTRMRQRTDRARDLVVVYESGNGSSLFFDAGSCIGLAGENANEWVGLLTACICSSKLHTHEW